LVSKPGTAPRPMLVNRVCDYFTLGSFDHFEGRP